MQCPEKANIDHSWQLWLMPTAHGIPHEANTQYAGRMVEHMQNLLPGSKFRPIVNIGQAEAAYLVQCPEANIEYS